MMVRVLAVGAVGLVLALTGCSKGFTQEELDAAVAEAVESAVSTVATTAEVPSPVTTILLTTTTEDKTRTFSVASLEQILEVTDVGMFNEPVQLVDDGSSMWVVERGGRVVSFDGEVLVDLEIDISEGSQESGLLGLEFGDDHYWLYVANPEDGTSGLYEVTSEIESLDEARLIRGWGEAPFHFGGHMELHGEWLYIGIGDGANGPNDIRAFEAQVREADRGAILRWRTGTDEWEVVANGLRNPWGWTLHEGWLYVGDVGHGQWEEVNVANVDSNPNFGWPVYEGFTCLSDKRPVCAALDDHTRPTIVYHHTNKCSAVIVGPVVDISWLDGALMWGDLCIGYLEAAWFDEGVLVERRSWPGEPIGAITSIGTDGKSIYVSTLGGRVVRVDPK